MLRTNSNSPRGVRGVSVEEEKDGCADGKDLAEMVGTTSGEGCRQYSFIFVYWYKSL